jgi:hypothetical protein
VQGESFATVARKHGLGGKDLVFYNFKTFVPNEINWYLANYVGCPEPKPGHKSYEFFGAKYDAATNTGVIFIPLFGNSAADSSNAFGDKVVENYNKSTDKEPGGRCYEACYARVKGASSGAPAVVPALDTISAFGRLWGSYISPKQTWLKLPEEYRGKGAAGAVAYAGLGTLVDSDGIWRGGLKPGAVIQVWKNGADFERVKAGNAVVDGSWGHSFIFLNYVYSGSTIVGMAIADQGYQSGDVLTKRQYAYWVGANLGRPRAVRDPNHVRYGPNP